MYFIWIAIFQPILKSVLTARVQYHVTFCVMFANWPTQHTTSCPFKCIDTFKIVYFLTSCFPLKQGIPLEYSPICVFAWSTILDVILFSSQKSPLQAQSGGPNTDPGECKHSSAVLFWSLFSQQKLWRPTLCTYCYVQGLFVGGGSKISLMGRQPSMFAI